MRHRTVGPEHDVPKALFEGEAKGDFPSLDPVQYAVLREDAGRLVGFLRFEFDSRGTLCAAGTWVASSERGKAAAKQMWRYLLRRCRPRRVWVRTVTPGGRALVAGLVRDFPKVQWVVVG